MKLAGAYINDDTYERLVALAAANNRTLAGECRHLFDRALRGELQVPDAPAERGRGTAQIPAPGQPDSAPFTQSQAAAPRSLRQTQAQTEAKERAQARTQVVRPKPGAGGKPGPQPQPRSGISHDPSMHAQGGGLPRPCAKIPPNLEAAAAAATSATARWVAKNLSVAGDGVSRLPNGDGRVCTPGHTPATGSRLPAPGADDAEPDAAAKANPAAAATRPMPTPRDFPAPR